MEMKSFFHIKKEAALRLTRIKYFNFKLFPIPLLTRRLCRYFKMNLFKMKMRRVVFVFKRNDSITWALSTVVFLLELSKGEFMKLIKKIINIS